MCCVNVNVVLFPFLVILLPFFGWPKFLAKMIEFLRIRDRVRDRIRIKVRIRVRVPLKKLVTKN